MIGSSSHPPFIHFLNTAAEEGNNELFGVVLCNSYRYTASVKRGKKVAKLLITVPLRVPSPAAP